MCTIGVTPEFDQSARAILRYYSIALLLREPIAIQRIVPRLEENPLASIAPLRHVTGRMWNDDASDAGHMGKATTEE